MKICGIIAEYNPFHDGHAYHLREAKRLSGADALVVVMSGYFVQRGEPAIYDPYVRARAALWAGADVVFMMPPEASTASAEGFAAYGIGVLDALGCDCISCGIEAETTENKRICINRLKEIAARLADEDEILSGKIRESLKSGMSYPAALAAAMGMSDRLGPNAILAAEYLKAMKRIGSHMEFIPVVRTGSGYNDTELVDGEYPSATALRRIILAGNDQMHAAETERDKAAGTNGMQPLGPDDMVQMIASCVTRYKKDLEEYADCSPEIAARMRKSRFHYKSFEEMVTDLKTRDVTYTRIARALIHVLLEIRKSDVHTLNSPSSALLIGFNDNKVLKELSKRSAQKSGGNFTIISKAADHREELESSVYAAVIYNQALWMKYNTEGKELFRQKILKQL